MELVFSKVEAYNFIKNQLKHRKTKKDFMKRYSKILIIEKNGNTVQSSKSNVFTVDFEHKWEV